MNWQIGTDEAGYGPNLGPLTVTGTLWHFREDAANDHDLYAVLEEVVRAKPSRTDDRLFVADSKLVHNSSRPLRQLERSVLPILFAATGSIPHNWQQLVEMVCGPAQLKQISQEPWMLKSGLDLPVVATRDEVELAGHNFVIGMADHGVELKSIRCQSVFPDRFNRELLSFGNKASLLSTVTLRIVRELLNGAGGDVKIVCDKHGGRSKYAGLLQEIVTEEFVFVGTESLQVSRYHFDEPVNSQSDDNQPNRSRRVDIRFQAKGESFLPTAVASMVSKYVREILMILWNDFWKLEIPSLKPTKGYPTDAKRFKADIAKKQQELGISDSVIWRNK